MIRISQIKLKLKHSKEDLENAICKTLKIRPDKGVPEYKIVKKSIDARKGEIKYIYSVDVKIPNETGFLKKINNKDVSLTKEKKYEFVPSGKKELENRPVVVGSGPAGLFCAYLLAVNGYRPLVIERGQNVDERKKTVEEFFLSNKLDTESNIQFGEGGAGTFSDGKLNTLVKDKYGRNDFVLNTFVKFGAPEEITYENKPHVGTDILSGIIKNMREDIIKNGGEFRFSTKLVDISVKSNESFENEIYEIEVEHSGKRQSIKTNVCVLALGHSARDTFKMLDSKKILMEPKAFAVGVRIEHPARMINESQYGENWKLLPTANYRLAKTLDNGRNVYSFCMCPGGYVVNASSEKEMLAVNGMSYSKRDGLNSNSALVVNITPDDFGDKSALGGIEFQRKLEKLAFYAGNGCIPVQTFSDFKQNVKSTTLGEIEPQTKGRINLANLREIFPEYISESLIKGIEGFGNQIKGFHRGDAVMSGVESRTSSPLRIFRNEEFESNIKGIYPCGEGAGYAGGITSAAMDGIKVFEAIVSKYRSD